MRYTAIDPGGTTGYAQFEDGMPKEIGAIPFEDFPEWLKHERPELFVVEDYIIRPGKFTGGYAHQWNKGVPLRVIGMIEYHVAIYGIMLDKQQPSIKPVAAGMFNLPNKGDHRMDAVLHGRYWWHKNGEGALKLPNNGRS